MDVISVTCSYYMYHNSFLSEALQMSLNVATLTRDRELGQHVTHMCSSYGYYQMDCEAFL